MKLYAAGLHQLDGVRFGRRWHGLLLLLATRTYNTALLALDAIHYGYPIQSIILSRSIYENVLTAGYVRRYPRQARFWLAKKYMADKASESIPRFGAMRAKEDKDTREKLKQMYLHEPVRASASARDLGGARVARGGQPFAAWAES